MVVVSRWRTLIGRSRLRICDIDCKRLWYMLNKRVLSDFLSGIKSQILILGINKGVL